MNSRITLLLYSLLFLGAPPYSTTAVALELTTTFSSRVSDDGVPRKTMETEFTCSDTIYALIEPSGLEPGEHEVEIHWMNPKGERQELTQFSAQTTDQQTLIWGWMRFHSPEDSGLVRTFDPSHGMRSFIGKWTVKVYIDGDQVHTGYFDVLC